MEFELIQSQGVFKIAKLLHSLHEYPEGLHR
jgi:hypothetical protein